jgi:hypothetical protein
MNNQSISIQKKNNYQKVIFYLAIGLILVSLSVRLISLNYRFFNEDEIEHLHVGFMIKAGLTPYTDFFEHHLPMFHYCLSCIFPLFENILTFLFFVRWLMLIFVICIFYLTFLIATDIFSKETGWLALMFLSCHVMFFEKSVEIRPDVPQTFLWLLSLFFFLKALDNGKISYTSISGLLIGTAFIFTQKTIYVLAPVCTAQVLWIAIDFIKKRSLDKIKSFTIYLSSFSIPLLCMFVYFIFKGAFKEFFDWNFVQASLWGRETYPWDYMTATMRQNSPFWILGLGFMLYCLTKKHSLEKIFPKIMVLSLSIIFLLIAMLWTSGPYRQTYMPILPLVAIFAGETFNKALKFKTENNTENLFILLFFIFLILAFSIPPIVEIADQNSTSNQEQIARINFVNKITKPTDVVFDGWGYGIKRLPAFYYHMLTVGVVNMMGEDKRTKGIIEGIKKSNTKVMLYDYRIKDYLPESTQNFLKANFVPTGFLDIWIAGKSFSREDIQFLDGNFNLITSALYKVIIEGKNYVAFLDGRKIKPHESAFINQGLHNIRIDGFYDRVLIRYDYENYMNGK